MSDSMVVLVALVLGFLPAAILALVAVMVVVFVALLSWLVWLFQQPPVAWLYALSLAFNAVVLVPLWLVSWLAAAYEPELWESARTSVYVFSGVFVLPTVLFYVMWQRAGVRDTDS